MRIGSREPFGRFEKIFDALCREFGYCSPQSGRTRPASKRKMRLWTIISLALVLSAALCRAAERAKEGFNPEVFKSKNAEGIYTYSNDPVVDIPQGLPSKVLPVAKPGWLLYEAPPAASSANTVVGLASFSFFMSGFQRLIGSLRHANYTGNIILGVSPTISKAESDYLIAQGVTMYTVALADCDTSIYQPIRGLKPDKRVGGGLMRGRCVQSLENLKVEHARFELARQWLSACPHCSGWTLLLDTRDSFFQADPFATLEDPVTAHVNLLFIEEIAPHTSPVNDPKRSFVAGNPRNEVHTVPCYGAKVLEKYADRPVLNSGTVIGTREGMLRFLTVLVDEFLQNTLKGKKQCLSPITTDQWIMNLLYYTGRFGLVERTVTLPWGMGPVQTLGKACVSADRKIGASDLVQRDAEGRVINRWDGRVPALVHQFDRCGDWMRDWMRSREDLFQRPPPTAE